MGATPYALKQYSTGLPTSKHPWLPGSAFLGVWSRSEKEGLGKEEMGCVELNLGHGQKRPVSK
jgi:hypothetical protein